jgi:hypothetical protein
MLCPEHPKEMYLMDSELCGKCNSKDIEEFKEE